MSTNSVVAYLRTDGSIVSSYVHYDGYETGVGMTLLEHFNDDKSALGVSVGGYYSSLSEDLDASLRDSVHNEEPEMFDCTDEERWLSPKGIYNRCESYCNVNQFCNQYKGETNGGKQSKK